MKMFHDNAGNYVNLSTFDFFNVRYSRNDKVYEVIAYRIVLDYKGNESYIEFVLQGFKSENTAYVFLDNLFSNVMPPPNNDEVL